MIEIVGVIDGVTEIVGVIDGVTEIVGVPVIDSVLETVHVTEGVPLAALAGIGVYTNDTNTRRRSSSDGRLVRTRQGDTGGAGRSGPSHTSRDDESSAIRMLRRQGTAREPNKGQRWVGGLGESRMVAFPTPCTPAAQLREAGDVSVSSEGFIFVALAMPAVVLAPTMGGRAVLSSTNSVYSTVLP